MISLEKGYILTPLQKLPKNVGDLAKFILPRALKTCPKSNKSPNLVTLVQSQVRKPLGYPGTPKLPLFKYDINRN